MEMDVILSQNHMETEEEEMMCLDGGARYSSWKGWTLVAVLEVAEYGVMAFGKYIKKAVGYKTQWSVYSPIYGS